MILRIKKYFGKADNARMLLLLLPGVIIIGTFTFYPIIKMFIMSFFDWKIGYNQVSEFIGIKNYIEIFSDPIAKVSLINTIFYAAVTVPLQMVIGLLVALLLNNIKKLSITLRLMYYLPVITSWVVVALLFRYIFSNEGLLNYLITDLFNWTKIPVKWLSTRWSAMSAITALGIWKGIGWNMVIFLAALKTVPDEYYEAASIDGAGYLQKFFHITLPNIKGTILFCAVMLTIGAFNTYTPIAVMTDGNPAHQTDVVLTWMYSQTFTSLKMGYSAGFSFIIAFIVAVVAIMLFRVLRTEG